MSPRWTFRPLGAWTEGNTPERRSRSAFRATWTSTLALLERELEHLDATRPVIQADFTEADIRADGMPRANARQPGHPGVRIAFGSRHGPLTYATDTHEFWQHNVRAIALGLEALRAVDRYGVTKRGEQYTGWKQLGAGTATPTNGGMTRSAALDAIARHVGLTFLSGATNEQELARLLRQARGAAHPDRNGGDSSEFLRLEQAGRILGLIT